MFANGDFVGMAASLAVPYKGLRKAFCRIHFNHILFTAALADEMRVAQGFRIYFRLLSLQTDQGRAASLNTLSIFPFHLCA